MLANGQSESLPLLPSALGIVAGKTPTEFKPNLSATRAEAVVMLYRALHKETVNMPTNQEVENVVLNFSNQLKQALVEKNFQKAQQIIDQYTTGFYNETTQNDFNFYQYVLNQGVNITTTHKGDLDVNHIDISPRFAVVELAGAQYESTYDKNTLQISEPYDLSGTYFLRKLPDGSWKIYNLYLNEAGTQGFETNSKGFVS